MMVASSCPSSYQKQRSCVFSKQRVGHWIAPVILRWYSLQDW